MKPIVRSTLLFVLLLASARMAFGDGIQLLSNPGFETGTPNVPFSLNGQRGGWSGANNWWTWQNVPGTQLTSELVPSTLPGGGQYMLSITTTQPSSGVYQFFPTTPSPAVLDASVWVYVASGTIGLATGANGDVTFGAFSSTPRWQELTFSREGGPFNEIVIYATSRGGATYFVDTASAVDPPPVPEPATLLLTGTGLATLLGRLRRRAR